MTEPQPRQLPSNGAPDGVAGTTTLRSGRFLLFMLGSFLLFLPGPAVAAAIAWKQYLSGGSLPASEGLFWLAAALIPLALLLATWLLPQRIDATRRAVEIVTPGKRIPVAVYDDIRVVAVWTLLAITTVVVFAGMVMSWLALTDCSAGTKACGTGANHSLVISALILAGGEVAALVGARLLARISFFGNDAPTGASPGL